MENMEIYEKVRSVPEEAQKRIGGGKLNGMTDINPMWRIKKLTETFGAAGIGWYTTILNKWSEDYGTGEVGTFVEINLFVKNGDEWSKPIYGIGGSKVVALEKGKSTLSDEAYKMAYTDAISVACKALGFGADIYWQGDKTKYSTISEPTTEYKCCDCGRKFVETVIKGETYSAAQLYEAAKRKNNDGKARCKECRMKHESEMQDEAAS